MNLEKYSWMRCLTGIGAVGKKGEAQQNDNVQKHVFFQGITVWKCLVFLSSVYCFSGNHDNQVWNVKAGMKHSVSNHLLTRKENGSCTWLCNRVLQRLDGGGVPFSGDPPDWPLPHKVVQATVLGGPWLIPVSFLRTLPEENLRFFFFDWTPGSPFPSYNHFFQRQQFHVFPPELYLFLLCLNTFVLPMGLIH